MGDQSLPLCFECNPNIPVIFFSSLNFNEFLSFSKQGDFLGYCGQMESDNCLFYDPTNSKCSVCLPGYVNNQGFCDINCTNTSLLPIPRIASCNQSQELIAFIDGGDREAPVSQPLTLDASLSEYTTYPSATLTYSWFCASNAYLNFESYLESCPVVSGINSNTKTTNPKLIIPANSYPLEKTFTFIVRVEANNLTSFYSVQVKFNKGSSSMLMHVTKPLYTYCMSKSYDFWVTISTQLDLNDYYSYTAWQSSLSFDQINATHARSHPTKICNQNLAYFDKYYYIKMIDPSNTASLTFPIKPQALGGTMIVTPSSNGFPYKTVFQVALSSWSDIDGGPLLYAFSYTRNLSNYLLPDDLTLISNFSSSEQASFYLPSYSPIRIFASIQDITGCVTYQEFDVDLTISEKTSVEQLQNIAEFSSQFDSSNTSFFSNLAMIISEVRDIDNLLDCRFNINLNAQECISGQIPYRCSQSSCPRDNKCSASRCSCPQNTFLADCSMESLKYDSQLSSRQAIMNFARSVLSETTNQDAFLGALTLLEALTKHAYLNTNSTFDSALQILNNTAAAKLQNTTPLENIKAVVQTASQIISNVINATIEKDCGLTTGFSLSALNSSYHYISSFSAILLKATHKDEVILQTDTWVSISKMVPKNQIEGIQMAPGVAFPRVQLDKVENTDALPQYVIVNYIYIRIDPTTCDDSRSSDFLIQIIDADSLEPIDVQTSLQITYSSTNFKIGLCAASCLQSKDASGNLVCSCPSANQFSLENQIMLISQRSQRYIANLLKDTITTDNSIYTRWSFWVALLLAAFFLISMAVGKSFNKSYCLVEKVRKMKRLNQEISVCYKMIVFSLAAHPLTNLFTFDDPYVSRECKILLYYVRQLGVLTFSAIFIPSDTVINATIFPCLNNIFSFRQNLILALSLDLSTQKYS